MDRFWLGFMTGLSTGIGASFVLICVFAVVIAITGVK